MPRNSAIALAATVFLALALSCQANNPPPSHQAKGMEDYRNGDSIELTGLVALVGSEPFTSLALRTNNVTWLIQKESAGIIKNFETKTVHVKAKVFVRQMTLANGKALDPQYELYDLELVQ